MRVSISCVILAAAIAITACGPSNTTTTSTPGGTVTTTTSNDGSTTTVVGANGETAQFTSGGAGAVQLPETMPLYPGAKVTTSVSGANNSQKTISVAFETNASVDDVVAFYKQKAAALGLSDVLSSTESGSTMFMATKDETMVQIIASKGTSSTEAQLTWAAPLGK